MEVTQNKEQNLISSDPMVAGIFRAVRAENGEPIEKLKAVIGGARSRKRTRRAALLMKRSAKHWGKSSN